MHQSLILNVVLIYPENDGSVKRLQLCEEGGTLRKKPRCSARNKRADGNLREGIFTTSYNRTSWEAIR